MSSVTFDIKGGFFGNNPPYFFLITSSWIKIKKKKRLLWNYLDKQRLQEEITSRCSEGMALSLSSGESFSFSREDSPWFWFLWSSTSSPRSLSALSKSTCSFTSSFVCDILPFAQEITTKWKQTQMHGLILPRYC